MESLWVRPLPLCNAVQPAASTHLACLLVHQMEHGVLLGVPVDAFAQPLPSQLTGHDLQQVHLDGLLDENHVILGHR